MTTFAFLPLCLRDARRIDRGELPIERVGAGFGNLLYRPDRAQSADGGAEERETGEKEERFLFGGSRHAVSLTYEPSAHRIKFLRAVSIDFRTAPAVLVRRSLTGNQRHGDIPDHLQTVRGHFVERVL